MHEPNARISRRRLLKGAAATSAAALTGACAQRYGGGESYLTGVLRPERRNAAFHWVDVALQSVRDQAVPPPLAAYRMGAPMAAGFLAANGVVGAYEEPFGVGEGPKGADPEVAYGAAFAYVAAETFQQPFLFDRMAFMERYPDGAAKDAGVEWGRRVGRHIARLRTDDGAEPSEINYYLGRYPARHDALRWEPTGPFYSARPGPAFATFERGLYPGMGAVTPWTMTHGGQFRAPDFLDPMGAAFAEQFAEVKALGGADSVERTEDQSEIAIFWEDGPWGITPPGHFMLIAMQVLQDAELSFIELARAMALVGMTQADAAIATWDSKYHHDIVRPETMIRQRAGALGHADPRVAQQADWRSWIPTPNFPAYTSGHSAFGAAGAEMTALLLGRDDVAFEGGNPDLVIWPQLKGVRRRWTSLSHAAEENGMSRIYGGVHWMADHAEGMRLGTAIARQAFEQTFPRKA